MHIPQSLQQEILNLSEPVFLVGVEDQQYEYITVRKSYH